MSLHDFHTLDLVKAFDYSYLRAKRLNCIIVIIVLLIIVRKVIFRQRHRKGGTEGHRPLPTPLEWHIYGG